MEFVFECLEFEVGVFIFKILCIFLNEDWGLMFFCLSGIFLVIVDVGLKFGFGVFWDCKNFVFGVLEFGIEFVLSVFGYEVSLVFGVLGIGNEFVFGVLGCRVRLGIFGVLGSRVVLVFGVFGSRMLDLDVCSGGRVGIFMCLESWVWGSGVVLNLWCFMSVGFLDWKDLVIFFYLKF